MPTPLAPAFIGVDLAKRYTVGEAGCRMTILALADASLRVERGGVTVVTGASELARTALLQIAAGLLRPDAGVAAWPAVDDDPRCSVPRYLDAACVGRPGGVPRVPACPSLLVIDGLTRATVAAAGAVLRRVIRTAIAFDGGVLLAASSVTVVQALLPGNSPTLVTLRPPVGAGRDPARRVAERPPLSAEGQRPS